jgi:hypothetical protein
MCVNLYTISVLPTTILENVRLQVHKHIAAYEPPWDLPKLIVCDPPDYTIYLVDGGAAILNGLPCTVGTSATPWSQVKELYRR